jgi:3-oxoacyl-[acyl-carrier protein] reductase
VTHALDGRVSLVTGGATGIGRSVALALASHGSRVVVNYRRSATEAEQVVAAIREAGGMAVAVQADVSRPLEASALVKAAEDRFGAIGILVNNAGVSVRKELEALEAKDWDDTLHTNLSSAFHVTQAALPGMRRQKWGRIIMMSSIAAQDGGLIGPHYAASKAGLIGLAHSYARLLAGEGITSNVITPALIDTEMVRQNPTARPDLIPVGRFGTPDEVASLVVELVSNGYVTGQTIGINGGRYLT